MINNSHIENIFNSMINDINYIKLATYQLEKNEEKNECYIN